MATSAGAIIKGAFRKNAGNALSSKTQTSPLAPLWFHKPSRFFRARRDYGKSSRPRVDCGADWLGDDVVAVMQKLNLKSQF
jgi:hypothetical protein